MVYTVISHTEHEPSAGIKVYFIKLHAQNTLEIFTFYICKICLSRPSVTSYVTIRDQLGGFWSNLILEIVIKNLSRYSKFDYNQTIAYDLKVYLGAFLRASLTELVKCKQSFRYCLSPLWIDKAPAREDKRQVRNERGCPCVHAHWERQRGRGDQDADKSPAHTKIFIPSNELIQIPILIRTFASCPMNQKGHKWPQTITRQPTYKHVTLNEISNLSYISPQSVPPIKTFAKQYLKSNEQ